MSRLYWVRHGESEVNITREFSHRLVDKPLTPKGILQAQQTAQAFRDKPIAAIYCSPMKRALETAGIIGKQLELPLNILENFREINIGDLEKHPPSAEAWAFFMEIMDAWQRGETTVGFPGGEDYQALLERVQSGLEYGMDRHPGETILVVAHGGSFMATLKDLCPDVDPNWLHLQKVANCSITELLLGKSAGRVSGKLVGWARSDHLSGEASRLVSWVPESVELIER